uniref:Uncharacterized protein n=1 Tax=Chrysemys picta bellii TaxID=8478 RepID=A0A8C3FCV4_CHRPI
SHSFCNATSSPTPVVMLCCFLWPGLWVQYMVLQVDLQWQTGSWLLEALVAQVCHLACGWKQEDCGIEALDKGTLTRLSETLSSWRALPLALPSDPAKDEMHQHLKMFTLLQRVSP